MKTKYRRFWLALILAHFFLLVFTAIYFSEFIASNLTGVMLLVISVGGVAWFGGAYYHDAYIAKTIHGDQAKEEIRPE